jgi:hypothetical protein
MDGLMAVKPLVHQPVKGGGDRRGFAERNLVFYHHVGHRMELRIFEFDSGSVLIVHHRVDPFGFIKFEPNL